MTVALLWTALVLWFIAVTWRALLFSLELYWCVGDGGVGWVGGVGGPCGVELQYSSKRYYIIKLLLLMYFTLYYQNFVLL